MIKRYENIYNPEGVFGLEVWWFFVKDTILFKHKPLGCVWVGGVVAFFLRYHPLKAHTTLSKSKKYMLFFFFYFNVGVRVSLRAPRLISRARKLTTM
jgi:hypothetical protein